MKTKRQGQSKLFVVLATLLAIVFFSFAGETNVKAAETYTQNYTPTRKSPLKKIEYINRGDNTFDINVTVDLSVYYPNDVLGIQEYDLTAWTNGTNKLMLTGKEYATSNSFGIVDYCGKFSSECQFSYGEDEFGNAFRRFPENSRFIKSEDILYEIKKYSKDRFFLMVWNMII